MKSNPYNIEVEPIPALTEILALYLIDYSREYPN